MKQEGTNGIPANNVRLQFHKITQHKVHRAWVQGAKEL